MAAESIGRETVDYVTNINKYYISYKFALERQERILKLREEQASRAEGAGREKALQAWRRSYSKRRD